MRKLKSYTQKPFSYVMVGKRTHPQVRIISHYCLRKAAIPEFAAILAAIKLIYEAMFRPFLSRDDMENQRQAATIQLNQKFDDPKQKPSK